MTIVRIIGVDPSLRRTGLAKGWLNLKTLEWAVDEVELVKTTKSTSKTIRKSLDDYDRSRILYEAVRKGEKRVTIAFAEMPIGSKSADAMKSYGACIMLTACIEAPLIQVTPREVKVEAVGSSTATKEEMIEWAVAKFPTINWLRARGPARRILNDNEHLADAVGAINAGMNSPDFLALVKMLMEDQDEITTSISVK